VGTILSTVAHPILPKTVDSLRKFLET